MNAVRPTKVWNLPELVEWRDDFIEMINEIHQFDDLHERLIGDGNSFDDENYLNELNSILGEIYGEEFDFIELIGHKFWKRYAFIRAMHLTRLVEFNDVKTKGLLVHSIDDYLEKAKSIFLNGEYPSCTEVGVIAAVNKLITDDPKRENNIYFYVTEYYAKCPVRPRYAEIGSEFMSAVAVNLGICEAYENNVKNKGISVVFVCNVPIENVYRPHIRDCLRVATFQLFRPSLDISNSLKNEDICIEVNSALRPSNIISHHLF